jgi:predicted metal-dependent HD superfamily phosphohydrolase
MCQVLDQLRVVTKQHQKPLGQLDAHLFLDVVILADEVDARREKYGM